MSKRAIDTLTFSVASVKVPKNVSCLNISAPYLSQSLHQIPAQSPLIVVCALMRWNL